MRLGVGQRPPEMAGFFGIPSPKHGSEADSELALEVPLRDHAALVVSARLAHTVRKLKVPAICALGEIDRLQGQMRSARISFLFGSLFLRYCHGYPLEINGRLDV